MTVEISTTVYPGDLRLFLSLFRNPQGGKLKDRFFGRNSLEGPLEIARVEGHEITEHHLSLGHFVSLDEDAIFAGLELEVVPNAQRRNHETHVQGELAPDGTDPVEEIPVLFFVHNRNQAVAHFQFQAIQTEKRFHLLRRRGHSHFLGLLQALLLQDLLLFCQPIAQESPWPGRVR